MDFRRKSTKKIVASGFVLLMVIALLATGASAADRTQDQLKDKDQIQDKDKLQDGSCIESSLVSSCTGDCDQTRDRLCDPDQDRLKDGSCQSSLVSSCTGDCDRDRLRDGSCLD